MLGEKPSMGRVWGESKLAKMECSESLTPHFVNGDHVTAEAIYSTVHACHEVLAWLWDTLCSKHVWTPLRERWHIILHHGCVHWSATRGKNIVCLLLWLLQHPGERLCHIRLCYGSYCGCCISQERIHVSAVLTGPQVFFWPLTLHLAYHGFSEQCAEWDTARQLASSTGSVIQPSSHLTPKTTPVGCQRAPALGFLCQTASSHWLSISHTVMHLFQCYSLKSSHLFFPTLCPKVCSLCLHLHCHVDKFICTIFLDFICMC